MARAAQDSRVVKLAREFGMKGAGNPVAFVVDRCVRQVTAWVKEFGPSNLEELLETVIAKVGLIIEEVQTDDDLEQIPKRYLQGGEGGFGRVLQAFDDRTFALVLRLRRPRHGCAHVAVIDCRGRKRARRWFSIWHEVAHLLAEPQLSFNFRRTVVPDKDPVEQLMDSIGGELAFYRPMFELILPDGVRPTLGHLEDHRVRQAPSASREAAYGTLIGRAGIPAVFIVAEMDFKASEHRALQTGFLFPQAAPTPELRAVRVVSSDLSRGSGLFIPRNMRVPPTSVISRVFLQETADLADKTWSSRELLSDWSDSKGNRLADVPVMVEAGRSGSRVFALITPA
jgi:hypothetical protein